MWEKHDEHPRTHTGEKLHECSLCDFSCSRAGNLIRQILRSWIHFTAKAGRKWKWSNGVKTKWNGHILVYIYHKQCGILQKNQWKGSNGQLQWFYKAMVGALCWKRQKTQKLEKLKCKLLKLLKGYDLYRGVPCESWRPELSENVVVFEIWSF